LLLFTQGCFMKYVIMFMKSLTVLHVAVHTPRLVYYQKLNFFVDINILFSFLAHLDEVEMSLCYTPGVRVPVRVRLKFLG
jgi:hypothetical protein